MILHAPWGSFKLAVACEIQGLGPNARNIRSHPIPGLYVLPGGKEWTTQQLRELCFRNDWKLEGEPGDGPNVQQLRELVAPEAGFVPCTERVSFPAFTFGS